MSINWTEINNKLPTGKSAEEKTRRKKMFREFDNGNGVLSLAETDKAIRDVLKIDDIFDAKPAIMRAFQIAKKRDGGSKRGDLGDDYIEWKEFRFFLLSLRQYFEYYVEFAAVDDNDDKRISLAEFKANQSQLEVWVGALDMEASFKEIDTNGGGFILFDEFCKWAIKKNLDLEDDDDDIDQ